MRWPAPLDIDLTTEPLGTGTTASRCTCKDIWPSPAEVAETVRTSITSEMFKQSYASVFEGDANWRTHQGAARQALRWDEPPPTSATRPTSTA